MRSATLLAGLLALAGPAAFAQDGIPPLRPAQDVVVTYRNEPGLPAGVGPAELLTRTYVSAATGRVRSENSGAVEITDRKAGRRWAFVLDSADPATRTVIEDHPEPDEVPLDRLHREPGFQVTRIGADRFAGTPCTRWRIRDLDEPDEADTHVVCVTADGLMLMSELRADGETTRQEAVRVEYGPLDPALFAPPPDWPVRREAR